MLLRSLQRHFTVEGPPNWRELVKPYVKRAAEGKIRSPSDTATDELVGYVTYYERELSQQRRTKVID